MLLFTFSASVSFKPYKNEINTMVMGPFYSFSWHIMSFDVISNDWHLHGRLLTFFISPYPKLRFLKNILQK